MPQFSEHECTLCPQFAIMSPCGRTGPLDGAGSRAHDGLRRCASAALMITLAVTGCATRRPTVPDTKSEAALRASGVERLSGRQVKAVLGKPLRYRWEGAGGAVGSAIVAADHSIRIFWETGAANGRLRFTQNGYCNRIMDQRRQPETCYHAYRSAEDEWTVFRESGEYAGRIHFQP